MFNLYIQNKPDLISELASALKYFRVSPQTNMAAVRMPILTNPVLQFTTATFITMTT